MFGFIKNLINFLNDYPIESTEFYKELHFNLSQMILRDINYDDMVKELVNICWTVCDKVNDFDMVIKMAKSGIIVLDCICPEYSTRQTNDEKINNNDPPRERCSKCMRSAQTNKSDNPTCLKGP